MKPSQAALVTVLKSMGHPRILDFGSKTGEFWSELEKYGDVYGCDLDIHPKLQQQKNWAERFRISKDPTKIPYEDESFDLVFANSVFEHVEPIQSIVSECARVLRPGGKLYAVTPMRSVIMEPHIGAPFATRFAAGSARRNWIFLMYRLGFGRRWRANYDDARLGAAAADAYMTRATHYRTYQEHLVLLQENFNVVRDRTGDLLKVRNVPRFPGIAPVVARFYATCFEAQKALPCNDDAAETPSTLRPPDA